MDAEVFVVEKVHHHATTGECDIIKSCVSYLSIYLYVSNFIHLNTYIQF